MEYSDADKKVFQHLIEMEEDLSTRLDRLTANLTASHSADSSEQAIERENDEVVEQLREDVTVELMQVQNALQRLKNGAYRECAKCGEEISSARLEALPYSTLCIKCAA